MPSGHIQLSLASGAHACLLLTLEAVGVEKVAVVVIEHVAVAAVAAVAASIGKAMYIPLLDSNCFGQDSHPFR